MELGREGTIGMDIRIELLVVDDNSFSPSILSCIQSSYASLFCGLLVSYIVQTSDNYRPDTTFYIHAASKFESAHGPQWYPRTCT